MLSFSLFLCITLFVVVCLFLVLLILIQKGRGGGLASAFGGAGGNTAFGAKTGDVLTWATSIVFGVFLFLAVVLNLLAYRYQHRADTADASGTTPTEDVTRQTMPPTPDMPGPVTPPPANP